MNPISGLLDYLASHIEVDADQLLRLRKKLSGSAGAQSVVYVCWRPSKLERCLLQRIAKREGLPTPERRLEVNDTDTSKPGSAVLSLRNRLGTELSLVASRAYRKSLLSFIRQLAERGRSPEEGDVVFVPASFFEGLGPNPWPARLYRKIDFWWLPLADIWLVVVMLAHRKNLSLDLGPLMIPVKDTSNFDVLRFLSLELYRKEKVMRGPKKKKLETIESIVLSGDRFEQAIEDRVTSTSSSRAQVYLEAYHHYKEIAASMKAWAVRVLYYTMKPVVRGVFQNVEVYQVSRLRKVAAKYPTVIVPSHRSHFDYILLGWIFFHAKMPLPFVAAGDNMNFWPIGRIFRSAGAFFIRRSIDDPLYKVVLDNYLAFLMKQGRMLAFYIEGGRSRSGAMRKPRMGILKYLIRNWELGGREDVHLIPIGISYERIAEEKAICAEQEGSKKKKESFLDIVRLRSIRKMRYGSVIVDVGEAISLKDFRASSQAEHAEVGTNVDLLTEDLGFVLSRKIQNLTAITGTSLSATAVSSFPEYSFSAEDVLRRMTSLLQLVAIQRGLVSRRLDGEEFQKLLRERADDLCLGGLLRTSIERSALREALEEVLGQYCDSGYLRRDKDSDGFYIPESNRFQLAYYKNNTLHSFVVPAVIALSSEQAHFSFRENAYQLHQLFKPFFLLPFFREWQKELIENIYAYRDLGILQFEGEVDLSVESDSADIHPVLNPTHAEELKFSATLLRPLIESVYAALRISLNSDRGSILEADLVRKLKIDLVEGGGFKNKPKTESATMTSIEFAMNTLVEKRFLMLHRESDTQERATGGQSRRLEFEEVRRESAVEFLSFLQRQLEVME